MPTITKVDPSQTMIIFHLSDGREESIKPYGIADPVVCHLYCYSLEQRQAWQLLERDTVASWPALNFQVSVEELK